MSEVGREVWEWQSSSSARRKTAGQEGLHIACIDERVLALSG